MRRHDKGVFMYCINYIYIYYIYNYIYTYPPGNESIFYLWEVRNIIDSKVPCWRIGMGICDVSSQEGIPTRIGVKIDH